MAWCPVFGTFLGVTSVDGSTFHFLVAHLIIGNALVVVVEEGVSSRCFQPFREFVIGVKANAPAVVGGDVVACTQFSFE